MDVLIGPAGFVGIDRRTRVLHYFAAATLLSTIWVAGCCESPGGLRRKTQLYSLAREYHWFYASVGRSPSDVDEFSQFVTERLAGADPYTQYDPDSTRAALGRLVNGELVLIWNADLANHNEAEQSVFLGHEKEIQRRGGYMVSGGGHVTHVSADEFALIPAIPTATISGESAVMSAEVQEALDWIKSHEGKGWNFEDTSDNP